MSEPHDALLGARLVDLERLLVAGHPLAPERLAGHRYRGIALATPYPLDRWVKKFIKVFHRDPDTGVVRGWNERVRQDGLRAPWTPVTIAGHRITFGHFEALAPGASRPYPRAMVLDYGRGEPPWSPFGPIRDVIAAIDYDRDTLLLGRTLLAFGPWQVPTPSYFLLLRDAPVDRVVPAPHRPL